MEMAWELGASYSVVSPQGTRTIPVGHPFGGEHAGSERRNLIPFVEGIMNWLPFEGASTAWSETSDYFGFCRVDPEAMGEIAKRAGDQFTKKRGLIGRWIGKKPVSHLGSALIFLPI